jgi:hypothetical protein
MWIFVGLNEDHPPGRRTVMSGMRWPHQVKPRHVGSIVNDQVKMWELQQGGRYAEPAADLQGSHVRQPGSRVELARKQDRLGFSYWGDVISTELGRLMHPDDRSSAYLNDGIEEKPPLDKGQLPSLRNRH